MTTTHQLNGRADKPGPLEAAAAAESRLITQMDAMAQRLDRLGTAELDAAKERLASAAASLADRVADAKAFVASTVTRVAHLLSNLCDDLSDDVTRCDEVNPPPLTPAETQAVAEAPWSAAAPAKLEGGGPADDEDYYDLVSNAGQAKATAYAERDDGRKAYRDGKALEANPHCRNTDEADAWAAGWLEAEREAASGPVAVAREIGKDIADALTARQRDTKGEPQPPAKTPRRRRKP